MIKIKKCVCNSDLVIGFYSDTFTKGEIYYLKDSKKGNVVAKSDRGRWIPIPKDKNYFTEVDKIFFKNREELDKMSI